MQSSANCTRSAASSLLAILRCMINGIYEVGEVEIKDESAKAAISLVRNHLEN